MTRRAAIEGLLNRYGEEAEVGGKPLRALIQPLRRHAAVPSVPDEYYDSLHYLYTGPAEAVPEPGEKIGTARRNYTVRRADVFRLGGEELYAWAVLRALPPDAETEIAVVAQGAVAALAERYTAKTVREGGPVFAWGEAEAVGAASGAVRYEIALENVRPQGGTDLRALTDFSLRIQSPGRTVTYTGCRWKSLTDAGEKNSRPLRAAELFAAGREERKDGETDGG